MSSPKPTLSAGQFISHAFDQPSTSHSRERSHDASPSSASTWKLTDSPRSLPVTETPPTSPLSCLFPSSSQASTITPRKPPHRHSKHKSRKESKTSSHIPDPPPRGTFSSCSHRAQRSSPSVASSSSEAPTPPAPVLSITELELFGQLATPPRYRVPPSPDLQCTRPEPPMSAEAWRETTERRRVHKFERALRSKDIDRNGGKENGGLPQLPLDIACGMIMLDSAGVKRRALTRILEPPLVKAARIRTMSWVDASPRPKGGMGMDVDGGDGGSTSSLPSSSSSVGDEAEAMNDVARKCASIKLSGVEKLK
ncbi:hypothetical protein BD410DRAFT_837438 [Rickenella mellea]|uniref:Uncharacterized protein n=1 Tax=Rickenella mellea TaxID=50990 RepID=A0A4Y7QDP9_9AGAM|nr:hypothetical protein BD410DRAFT_837438 [Rickenella mellea]